MREIALTVHQPWAWAIVAGHKRWENRTWPLPRNCRGKRVWIHAGLSTKWLTEDNGEFFAQRGLAWPRDARTGLLTLSFGVVLGCVVMPYSVPVDELHARPSPPAPLPAAGRGEQEQAWAFGPHCWRCDEARQLATPVRAVGQQGLWSLPADVAAACLAQLDRGTPAVAMTATIDATGDARAVRQMDQQWLW